MEFIVKELSGRPGTAYVRYDCACGCKPGVEYERNSADAAFEQCCCGNIHLVGPAAGAKLAEHIKELGSAVDELGGYASHEVDVEAPWGGSLQVAYAIPARPRAH